MLVADIRWLRFREMGVVGAACVEYVVIPIDQVERVICAVMGRGRGMFFLKFRWAGLTEMCVVESWGWGCACRCWNPICSFDSILRVEGGGRCMPL